MGPSKVAIPFRVGWGFQPEKGVIVVQVIWSRNPFQGGVGFSTVNMGQASVRYWMSQSLSGWGGVFNVV